MMMNGRPAPRLAGTPLRLSGTLLLAVSTLFRVPEVPVAAAQGQRPTFEATATRVRVDVIVTDSSGRFVADLEAADFRLFEDDAPQEILSVDVVKGGVIAAGERTYRGEQIVAFPPSREADRNDLITGGGETVSGLTDLGAVVYLVDTRRLEPKGMARLARAWRDQLGDADRLSRPRAAYLIDTQNFLRELAPLATDPQVLEEAVDALEREPSYSLPPIDGGAPRDSIAGRVSEVEVLTLIERVCSSLGALSGRKTLIWVSGGFRMGSPFQTKASVMAKLEALVNAANNWNVSIYAIDPTRAIDSKHNFYREAFDVTRRSALGERGRVSSQLFASSLREFAADDLRRGLAYAARATGGLAYESWSDIDRVLTDIEEESGSYYLLTYEPPARRGDGQHHAIRVEVSDAALQLRYRRGYVDYREGERRELRLEGALTAPGVTRGFPLELASIETTETRGGSIVLEFVGNLPAEARALSQVGGTDLAFAVSGVAIPRGRNRLIHARQWLRWSDLEVSEDLASDRLRFEFAQAWALAPGEYELRVALYSPSTQEVAVTRADLCVEAVEAPTGVAFGYSARRCDEPEPTRH